MSMPKRKIRTSLSNNLPEICLSPSQEFAKRQALKFLPEWEAKAKLIGACPYFFKEVMRGTLEKFYYEFVDFPVFRQAAPVTERPILASDLPIGSFTLEAVLEYLAYSLSQLLGKMVRRLNPLLGRIEPFYDIVTLIDLQKSGGLTSPEEGRTSPQELSLLLRYKQKARLFTLLADHEDIWEALGCDLTGYYSREALVPVYVYFDVAGMDTLISGPPLSCSFATRLTQKIKQRHEASLVVRQGREHLATMGKLPANFYEDILIIATLQALSEHLSEILENLVCNALLSPGLVLHLVPEYVENRELRKILTTADYLDVAMLVGKGYETINTTGVTDTRGAYTRYLAEKYKDRLREEWFSRAHA